MPFINLLYTRKWTKMFAPISTLITQLGNEAKHIFDKKKNTNFITILIRNKKMFFLFFLLIL